MSKATFPVTQRNKVLRLAKRGHYDRETVYAVVDAALICRVACGTTCSRQLQTDLKLNPSPSR